MLYTKTCHEDFVSLRHAAFRLALSADACMNFWVFTAAKQIDQHAATERMCIP